MKKLIMIIFAALMFLGLSGCETDARLASRNLSKAADMFEITRRIVFYNGITDAYILSIEGRCSVEFTTLRFIVTCKTGPGAFKKHYLGRADNVFPFIEQMESAGVSVYQYRVIFKPESIIPNVDLSTSS
jgi:hypothetical protein